MRQIFKVLILFLFSLSAQANWVCNVANTQNQHWTFSAPTLDNAENMAKNVCASNTIDAEHCTPDCYDNGCSNGRWHCVIANKKAERWSYFAPTEEQAKSLAKYACNEQKINPENCTPQCIAE